jgi:hypothetical protein
VNLWNLLISLSQCFKQSEKRYYLAIEIISSPSISRKGTKPPSVILMHHTVLNKINEKFKDVFFSKQKDLPDRVSGIHWVFIEHLFAT